MLDVERCPTPPNPEGGGDDDEVFPINDVVGGVNPEPVPPPLVTMEVLVPPALLLVPPNVGPIVFPGPENESDFGIGIDPLNDVEGEDRPTLPSNDDDVTCSLPNLSSEEVLPCICSCPRRRDPSVGPLLLPLLPLLLSNIVLEYRSSLDTELIGEVGMEEVE
jgi:hypothetical protein